MMRRRRTVIAAAIAASLMLSYSSSAAAKPVLVGAGGAAHWTVQQPWWRTFTPCFYVGHRPLLFGEQSDHRLVTTFYGDGTIARLRQLGPRSNVMRVTVITVNPQEHVRLRLVNAIHASC